MLDFIMNHYIIVMVVIAFVLFAIIGFIVDTNKQSQQVKEEAADLAKAEALVNVVEVAQPPAPTPPVAATQPVPAEPKIAPDPSVDPAIAEPKVAPDPAVEAAMAEAKIAPDPSVDAALTGPATTEVKDNK